MSTLHKNTYLVSIFSIPFALLLLSLHVVSAFLSQYINGECAIELATNISHSLHVLSSKCNLFLETGVEMNCGTNLSDAPTAGGL